MARRPRLSGSGRRCRFHRETQAAHLRAACRRPRFYRRADTGGTGALRLAAELIAAASPESCVWIGTPTWPNHQPIMQAAGLSVRTYRYFDPATQTVRFDEMMAALDDAVAGDVVLLHGCCHNPSGADLDLSQWLTVADLLAERGLIR